MWGRDGDCDLRWRSRVCKARAMLASFIAKGKWMLREWTRCLIG